MKGMRKAFSGGLAIWREWRMIGLLRGSKYESVLLKKKRVGC